TFIHWGRLVNQHRLGSFENGRKLGYDRDLEKMLVLSYSDKSVDQTTVVTGKFGLGFKSVFLVSATPLLLSGRLGVQITAGMYPQYLQPETLQLLRNKASAASSSNDSSAQATLVQLPLDEDQDPDRILEDMVSMAHVILVFARRIKCCRLGGNTLRWQEEAFKDTKSVFYGRLQPAVGSQHQAARALVLRSQAGPGALLLVLDKEGVSSLDSSVPTMWVTAPTRHRLNLGFALNGPFELDVGRAQLAAAAPANAKLACQIGRDLGQALSELYVACRDWPEARLVLGLEANVTPYRFWDSLWQRLGPPLAVASSLSERTTSYGESSKNPALDYKIWASKPFLRQAASVGNDAPITLLRNMLWDSNEVAAGMTRLIRDHAALPTGLWGDYQCLTTLNRVRYVISGFLDKSEEAFGIAIRWVSSYDGVSKDSLISSERVWRHLRGLSPDIKQITILDLPAIVRREIGRRDRVSPEIAGRLGALITRERLQEIERERHPEHRLLVEFLRTLRFGAHNGHFSPATELLIGQGESKEQEDERARAAFAPEGRVLGPDYGAIARQFFLACRGPLRAPAEELARWALDVTPTQRNAVLRYVLGGELSIELAESLRSHPNFASSWLAQLNRDSDLLTAFDGNERGIILGRLGLFTAAPPFRSPLPRLDPVAALEKVYCWWQAHKEQLTRQYDEKIYPNGARLVCSDTFDPQSQEDRTQWLTLFLLGSFFTMGRTRPEQHRGFIQQCQEKGWLAVFAAPTMQADNWIDILDQYMDDQSAESTYYQWMKHFISIYQLSRWLPEYVDSFLAIQRFNDAFSLDQITRSRTSPAFQRGGPDAPPVMRPLGIGACFVVRELVRARVLTSHHAFPHCFVPTRQVREMMIQLGCQLDLDSRSADNSRVIYDFLTEKLGEERATLQQSFDIPFYYIAQKWSGSVAEFLRAQG
ncbi:MAG: hypothetical protein H8D43_01940, partial [Chloroflexi bacterium]|nr:hypothetical protein [Chloroflexota bacterium]